MVLCALRRQLLRSGSRCGTWTRLLQRPSSGCVYSSTDGFNHQEIREKLQAFPGGSIDLLKQDSGIAVLTINNPSRMNAFSGSMMVDLEERVTQLENWTGGKGLIVQGAAETFCSGSDLNAVRAISNPQDGMKMCMFMQNTLTRLVRPKNYRLFTTCSNSWYRTSPHGSRRFPSNFYSEAHLPCSN
uniref:Ethylmalonyl-CoA decarboxylase 1 n=1 Tax=Amphiprion ocellaris TaxID=80972 RepID=A0AAQ5ZHL2_AMPOC